MEIEKTLRTAAALALTVALAGCPAPAAAPGGGTQPGGQAAQPSGGTTAAQPAGAEGAQAAAEALGDEQAADDYDYLADAGAPASYVISQATPSAKPSDKPSATDRPQAGEKGRIPAAALERLKARRAEIRAKIEARLAKRGAEVAAKIKDAVAGAPETANADGSKTKSAKVSDTKQVGKASAKREMTITRTRNADGALVYSKIEVTQTLPNGMSRSFTRERTVGEDGVITIKFHRERTGKNGAKWVADWTKTIGADGGVTGTGTLTVTKDGQTKTHDITLGGREEATTASTKERGTNNMSDVAVDASGKATAKVKDDKGNTTDAAVEADADVSSAADAE